MSGVTTYTPEKEQEAIEYITGGYEKLEHVIPSVVGMAVAIKVSKSTLYKWAKDDHGTFSNTLAQCEDAQHIKLLAKGLTNEFNPTIVKLALANHGYSEKTSTDVTSGGEPIKNEWHIHPTTSKHD